MTDPVNEPGKDARAHALSSESGRQPHSLDAADLFRGEREVAIRHRGECYRLRLTQSDKLILTK